MSFLSQCYKRTFLHMKNINFLENVNNCNDYLLAFYQDKNNVILSRRLHSNFINQDIDTIIPFLKTCTLNRLNHVQKRCSHSNDSIESDGSIDCDDLYLQRHRMLLEMHNQASNQSREKKSQENLQMPLYQVLKRNLKKAALLDLALKSLDDEEILKDIPLIERIEIEKQLHLLSKIFNYDKQNLIKLLKDYPDILFCERENIDQVINSLAEFGCDRLEVVKNPWLFFINEINFTEKLEKIKIAQQVTKIQIEAQHIIPFFIMTQHTMKRKIFLYKNDINTLPILSDYKQRAEFLCEVLEINPQKAFEILIKNRYMHKKSFEEIKEITRLIKVEGNVQAEKLRNNLTVFNYTVETISHRVNEMKQAGVKFKVWAVQLSYDKFIKHININRQMTEIMNGENFIDFVAESMKISTDDILEILDKKMMVHKIEKYVIILKKYKLPKEILLKNLDFLKICPDVLEKRIKLIRKVFENDVHLNFITLSEVQFKRTLFKEAQKQNKVNEMEFALLEQELR